MTTFALFAQCPVGICLTSTIGNSRALYTKACPYSEAYLSILCEVVDLLPLLLTLLRPRASTLTTSSLKFKFLGNLGMLRKLKIAIEYDN